MASADCSQRQCLCVVPLRVQEQGDLVLHPAQGFGLLAGREMTGQRLGVRDQCAQQRPSGHVRVRVVGDRRVQPVQGCVPQAAHVIAGGVRAG